MEERRLTAKGLGSRVSDLVPHLLVAIATGPAQGAASPVTAWAPWVLRSVATVDYAAITARLTLCS